MVHSIVTWASCEKEELLYCNAASFTPENRMLVHGEIHNRHREESEKVIAAERGKTESFIESVLSQRS